ncbi:hypothetical protein [Nonomuraea sp. NPDC050310]|uniref:hypothetical protein n=1 Tax=unclassified Nonomuraea TaxID=2593643 RepID=UPI0033C3BE3C
MTGSPEISGVAGQGGAQGAQPSSSPAGPQSSAPPSAAALAPEDYKGKLRGVGGPVRESLDGIASARTVKTLDQRVERAERELREAADGLAALVPPAEVAAQHQSYVSAMRDFSAALGSTLGKVGSRAVCTPSAVFTDLGGKLKALDSAGQALQKAGGYPADVVSVKAAGKLSRRLGNGSFVRSGTLNGRSSLQIHNGASRDAVVTLMRGDSRAFSIYVRRKAKFKVRGVRDGTYRIFFTHGVDWDSKARAFTRDCSFERFQDKVRFKTTYTSTRILWHDWRITLHAISGGTAKTSTVDPGDFPG